ncbi:hypothetical protein AAJV73_03200 [Cyanobium sp. BSA11S]|uniref:hypothetical protein n=1 Tax=Synechococcales TaxID=1890424 RepID=UPI001C8ABEB4|nr:hypothetical protein [Synechococcus sp. BSF8S]
MLELSSASYRRQVLTALKDTSDLVFLSQLARVRCTPEAEVELLAHYLNVNISAGARVLLFGHPTQTASHLTGLVNGLQRRLGLGRSLQLAPMLPKESGQPRLAVEQIIQILVTAPGVPQSTVHVFQSAILPLRILFPTVPVRFGYGADRIRTHFFPQAAERQLLFEASMASCLCLAPVPV